MDTLKKCRVALSRATFVPKMLQKSVLDAPIFFELRFIIEENPRGRHTLVDRVIKKFRK